MKKDTLSDPSAQGSPAPATRTGPDERSSTAGPSRRTAFLEIAAIAIGALIAGWILLEGLREETNFADLALGDTTTAIYAELDGSRIHCKGVEDADECLEGIRARHAGSVALWLGNSQIHAVNQWKPGEETATPIVHRDLAPLGVDFVAFSMPNATLEEHYVLFAYLIQRVPIDYLVLPVVFDDLREGSIRAEIAGAFRDPQTLSELRTTDTGRRLILNYDEQGTGDLSGVRDTTQQYTEQALDSWLDRHSTIWSHRPEARGRLFSALLSVRNTVLGITPQSKRKMIQARYDSNLQALESILALAEREHVRVVLYVAPLRGDVEAPYVSSEYDRFKRDLSSIAAEHDLQVTDLEGIVPGPLWGLKSRHGREELDFMHFQAPGHALLAEAISDELKRQIPRAEP